MTATSIETTQVASALISPSTLYYFALYALVLIVRFFKLKKETPSGEWDWKAVFHVSLEIVYTSSGLVILLLEGLKAYVPVIIIVYLMLVLVSSQIESMEERFSKNAAFYTHLGIIVVVAVATALYFEVVQRDIDRQRLLAKQMEEVNLKAYRVAILYEDQTLRAHIGQRLFGNRQLVAAIPINAENAQKAKEKALVIFWQNVKPFKDVEDPRSVLFVPQDMITAELERKQVTDK